jgi:hypothetical protein
MPKHNKPLSGGNNWNRQPDKIKHNKKRNNNPWSQNYGQDEDNSVYGNNIPSYKYSQPQLLTPEELLSPIDENGQKLANFASRVAVNVWQRQPFVPPQSKLSFSENNQLSIGEYGESPKYPHSKGGLSFDGKPKIWEEKVIMERAGVNSPLTAPYNPYKTTEFRVDRDMDILIAFDDEYKRKMGWDKDEKLFESETEKIAKRIKEIYTNNGFDVSVLVVSPYNLESLIPPYNYPKDGFEGFNIFSVLFMGSSLADDVGVTHKGELGNRNPLEGKNGYDPLGSCFVSFNGLQEQSAKLSMTKTEYDEFLAITAAHELYHALIYRAYILSDHYSSMVNKKKSLKRAKNGYCLEAAIYSQHDTNAMLSQFDNIIDLNIEIIYKIKPYLAKELPIGEKLPRDDFDTYLITSKHPSFTPNLPPKTSFKEDAKTPTPSLRLPGIYMPLAFGKRQSNDAEPETQQTFWYDFFHEKSWFWQKDVYPNRIKLTKFHDMDKKYLEQWHIYWGNQALLNFQELFKWHYK